MRSSSEHPGRKLVVLAVSACVLFYIASCAKKSKRLNPFDPKAVGKTTTLTPTFTPTITHTFSHTPTQTYTPTETMTPTPYSYNVDNFEDQNNNNLPGNPWLAGNDGAGSTGTFAAANAMREGTGTFCVSYSCGSPPTCTMSTCCTGGWNCMMTTFTTYQSNFGLWNGNLLCSWAGGTHTFDGTAQFYSTVDVFIGVCTKVDHSIGSTSFPAGKNAALFLFLEAADGDRFEKDVSTDGQNDIVNQPYTYNLDNAAFSGAGNGTHTDIATETTNIIKVGYQLRCYDSTNGSAGSFNIEIDDLKFY